MLPSVEQGAVNEIQNAVILSNCLYDLKVMSLPSATDAFKDYRTQYYKLARAQFDTSSSMSKIVSGQHCFEKSVMYRPQLNWIPVIPTRGTVAALPQKPNVRCQEKQKVN